MKITAEFNSNEELLDFIGTFGAKVISPEHGSTAPIKNIEPGAEGSNMPQEDKKVSTSKDTSAEKVKPAEKANKPTEGAKEETSKGEEDPKITKEMIREVFTKIIKAGKQKEAKALTEKYGAARLPELKEEHYAAVYKEAEALL